MQKFHTARCLQNAKLKKYSDENIDISSAKYSSLQEVRAVEFRKVCSNFIN